MFPKLTVACAIAAFFLFIGCITLARSAGETVVLRTIDNDTGRNHLASQERGTRLWVVDEGGRAWVLGRPGTGWYERARTWPVVVLVRGGEAVTYRANVVNTPATRAGILGALALKYGLKHVSLFYSVDEVVPIRLDPIRP
ncbi:MAG: hypothetical protein V3T08_09820 [Gemmatimonadota bacterium]